MAMRNYGKVRIEYWIACLFYSRVCHMAELAFADAGHAGEVLVYARSSEESGVSGKLHAERTSSRDTGKIREIHPQKRSQEDVAAAFDAYGNSILRLAYSYLHSMEDAEDILQDTLIRYMDRAPSFENGSHEKAWLLRVTANLSKNKISYNKIREIDELKEELVAEKRDDLSFVWESVKMLPQAQREVIHLYYQESLTTAEIARVLEEKESTVRSHLKRGRDRLKEILREEYDFNEI